MFKNEYQGGPTVDILSAQGKDPLNKWKIYGNPSSLKRQYDKDVKSNVYSFDGSTTTCKMQLPRDGSKQTLGLTQRFLTIQIFIPKQKDFAVELIMTDKGNSKRRFVISTTVRENYTTPLHAKLNLSMIRRQSWLNLCFDLFSLIEDTFPRQTFKSLDSISLSGTCKVRRIFTMRNQPPDTSDMADTNSNVNFSQLENIPPALQFSSTIQYITQVVTVPKIRSFLRPNTSTQNDIKDQSGYWSSSSDDQSKPKLTARDQGQTVIAFGSTIRVDKNKLTSRDRKDSTSSHTAGVASASSSLISRSGRKIKQPTSARKSTPSHSKTSAVNSNQKHPTVINIDTQSSFSNTNESEDANDDQKFKKPAVPVSLRSQRSSTNAHNLTNLPPSLVDLVDDLSDSDSNDRFSSPRSVAESEVFMFSSRPHSATSQKRTESESSSFSDLRRNNVAMEKDFEKSDSSDSEEEIRKKIFERTPSPRLMSSPEHHKFSLPIHSSVTTSPSQKSLYDSQKYKATSPSKSLQPEVRKSVLPPHRSLNRSIVSLRSSDATITASVETLKQKSVEISVTHDDSLESQQSGDNSPLSKFNDSSAIDQNYLHVTTSPRSQGDTSQRSVTVARKSLRELPISPPSHNSPRVLPTVPEFKGYKVGDLSDSMEAAMLADLKREQDAEINDVHNQSVENDTTQVQHKYDINVDESFDTSWSTWKQPPEMHSSAYKDEMEGSSPVPKISDTLLGLSLGKQDVWGNLSPPIVMPIDRERQEKESISDIESNGDVFGLSDGSTVSGKSGSTGLSDEEEMLDLMYDPCLNCYFDPRTQRYYELKG